MMTVTWQISLSKVDLFHARQYVSCKWGCIGGVMGVVYNDRVSGAKRLARSMGLARVCLVPDSVQYLCF